MNRFQIIRMAGVCLLTLAFGPSAAAQADKDIALTFLGVYESGIFNADGIVGSEVAAYDKHTRRLFITNVSDNTIDVVSLANPAAPSKVGAFDLSAWGASPNSVASHNGLVVAAVQADPKTDPGKAVFFRATGTSADDGFVAAVTVGALPDMVTFTPDGKRVLVANEGEPDFYGEGNRDPEGSVSIIDVSKGSGSIAQSDVTTATLTAFNGLELDESIRIYGPGATVAMDLEPEYITVSDDSRTAWVTLQENNAIAELDVRNGVFTRIMGLGFKDHSVAGAGLDGSDRDGPGNDPAINIATWPLAGMYLPDALASYRVRGQTYLVTANEGDAREWPHPEDEDLDFEELARISSLTLNPAVFDPAAIALIKSGDGIGRLEVSRYFSDTDGDEDTVERLLALGGRSFSIWTTDGQQVFDSGDQFERVIAEADLTDAFGDLDPGDVGDADVFNSGNDANDTWDTRSDAKGPEPEGVYVAHLWGRWYAFIALERVGGVMVYDVTEPASARFVQYVSRRNFAVPFDIEEGPVDPHVLDLGPETLFVIPGSDSPTGTPVLVVSNEVSGTTTLFEIARVK